MGLSNFKLLYLHFQLCQRFNILHTFLQQQFLSHDEVLRFEWESFLHTLVLYWTKLWKLNFQPFSTIFPTYFHTVGEVCPIFPVRDLFSIKLSKDDSCCCCCRLVLRNNFPNMINFQIPISPTLPIINFSNFNFPTLSIFNVSNFNFPNVSNCHFFKVQFPNIIYSVNSEYSDARFLHHIVPPHQPV